MLEKKTVGTGALNIFGENVPPFKSMLIQVMFARSPELIDEEWGRM